MKKYLLLCVVCYVFITTGNGQTKHSITIGPQLGIPSKNLKNGKLSLGFSGEFVYKFTPQIAGRLYSGFNKFKGKYSNDFVSFWPTRIGLQAFLNAQEEVFIFADAGISSYSASNGTKQTGSSESFGFGLRQRVFNKIFQFSAYYNIHNFRNISFGQNLNYSWFNVRAAYGFSFGKDKAK